MNRLSREKRRMWMFPRAASASTNWNAKLSLHFGGQNGRKVRLFVEQEALVVHGSVEVNGKRRHTHDGPVNLHEFRLKRIPVPDDDSASDGQVTIKPRVPQTASIALHADTEVPK